MGNGHSSSVMLVNLVKTLGVYDINIGCIYNTNNGFERIGLLNYDMIDWRLSIS